jgi:tRNA threonylcarbamoyl adenosine modification protein (Sua5/YciO/YrdC/YwlC family)
MTVVSADFEAAASALRSGAVVAIPTDTVYGLAVDPSVPGSTAALFALKARPASLELPVLVATMEQFAGLAGPEDLPEVARRLARSFWPGALTIVVPRRAGLDWDLGGHGDTIGVRCPDHAGVRWLCAEVGPLATTSANLHGAPPCTDAVAVADAFASRVAVVVDGGRCDRPPSTVAAVGPDGLRCLRPGALSWDAVAAAARAG